MAEHMAQDKLHFQKPQINLARPTAARMWIISLCAFLAVIQSSLGDSFSSLILALCVVAAAVLTEFFFLYFKSGKASALKDGSAVASALVFTLLLPNQISPVYAVAGAVFAIAIVKHSFGGLGSNWLNPAAAGWLFVRFSWPASFPGTLEASSLSLLFERLRGGSGDYIPGSAYLYNQYAYGTYNTGGGLADFLSSPLPGIIADRGSLALLIGTVIIVASRVNRFWIPLVYLAVFGVLARFAGALPYGGAAWDGDALFAICTGGTLAAAFFLASDPATSTKSNRGILFAAAAGGALAFFFRFYGGEPYGAFFAAVFINAMLPLVRVFERHKLYGRYSS